MDYFSKATNYALRGVMASIVLSVVGAVAGSLVSTVVKGGGDTIIACAVAGFVLCSAPFGAIAMWFVFLHMLSQVAAAVRGK
jgi:tellurite resistance protein TehA-like permease